MKIVEKSNLTAWAALASVLFALLACGREAGPSGVRKPADAAAAASASGSTPNGAVSPDQQTGRKGDEEELGVQHGGVVLEPVTAEQLLAEIRSSGNKATLVNAWASWCGPCRRELPMLQALAVNLKPQGVAVVLVSVDDPKDESKAASFLKDNSIDLKSYLAAGSLGDFKRGLNPRWPGMLPASFLFDRQATLVHFWGGEAFEKEIVPVIDDFVAGRPITSETRFGLAPGKVEN